MIRRAIPSLVVTLLASACAAPSLTSAPPTIQQEAQAAVTVEQPVAETSGQGAPADAQFVESARVGAPPPPSPAVEAPFPVEHETLQTSQGDVEQSVRDLLNRYKSQIETLSSSLTTVHDLEGGEQQSASRVLSGDSPVWRVAITGDLREPGPVHPGNTPGTMRYPTCREMSIILSAQDARILFLGMKEPVWVDAPVASDGL